MDVCETHLPTKKIIIKQLLIQKVNITQLLFYPVVVALNIEKNYTANSVDKNNKIAPS